MPLAERYAADFKFGTSIAIRHVAAAPATLRCWDEAFVLDGTDFGTLSKKSYANYVLRLLLYIIILQELL